MHSAIEAIIKTLPIGKTDGQMDSQQNSKQTFKKIYAIIPQIIPMRKKCSIKYLQTEFQENIKKIICHDQVVSSQRCRDHSAYRSQQMSPTRYSE